MTLVPCSSPEQIQKNTIKSNWRQIGSWYGKGLSSDSGHLKTEPEAVGTLLWNLSAFIYLALNYLSSLFRTSYIHSDALLLGISFSPSNSCSRLTWLYGYSTSPSLWTAHQAARHSKEQRFSDHSMPTFATYVWPWISHLTSLGFSSPFVKSYLPPRTVMIKWVIH